MMVIDPELKREAKRFLKIYAIVIASVLLVIGLIVAFILLPFALKMVVLFLFVTGYLSAIIWGSQNEKIL